ncbi:hypothetical protein M2197_006386 [Bradyrhizobium japonicum]|nr:hypothetical protein [Bradyrhizobium japonicum]MCS3992863.1 hypothetical protein [Bradyrhizobium japonicum]MCS4021205.1 hypothetical protein [Bradyrhizobium japonicum]MCS4208314.1 hypothetical protein [Bradyrhizobium japonicum]
MSEPTKAIAMSTMRRVMPPPFMISPIRMKSGMAIRP